MSYALTPLNEAAWHAVFVPGGVERMDRSSRELCAGLAVYQSLVYVPGQHTAHRDNSETYSVEGDNVKFRHYLARLARGSRCFSRCIEALRRAIQLFV